MSLTTVWSVNYSGENGSLFQRFIHNRKKRKGFVFSTKKGGGGGEFHFRINEPCFNFRVQVTNPKWHSYSIRTACREKKRHLKYIPEKVKPRTGYCTTCMLSFIAPTVDRVIVHMLHGAILHRVAQKECNTYASIISGKRGGKWKKLCALMHIEFFSQHDTNIINFDEGVLILWPFFWGNVIFKICHFCLKSHNWRTENFHCLAPPGKVSTLALKNEDSMNKGEAFIT